VIVPLRGRPVSSVVERLRKRRNLAAAEFTFLRSLTCHVARVTLPSPSLLGA
jgi:hypothetical protein